MPILKRRANRRRAGGARPVAVCTAVAVGGLLAAVATAWACLGPTEPYLEPLSPNSGPAGTVVKVTGGMWDTGGDVVLSWVAKGHSPQVLGTARPTEGGYKTIFFATVTIPASAEVGSDYVGYVQASQGGSTVSAAFGVDSPAEAGSPAVPSPPPSSSASTSGDSGSANPAAVAGYDGGSGGLPARPAASSAASPDPLPSPAPSAAAGPGGDPSGVTQPRGLSVGASGPVARVPGALASRSDARTGGTAAAPTALTAPASPAEAAVSARTANADLWSGYDAATPGGALPSLSDLHPAARPASPVAVGAGVLTVGLLALAAGFAVAEVRSRRVSIAGQ